MCNSVKLIIAIDVIFCVTKKTQQDLISVNLVKKTLFPQILGQQSNTLLTPQQAII